MHRFCAVVLLAASALAQYPSGVGTVYVTNGVMSWKPVIDTSGVAWGNFSDQSVHPSAFGMLEVVTNAKFPDIVQAE